MVELMLSFSSFEHPELFETRFCHPLLKEPVHAMRGRRHFIPAGTFPWSSAVHALTLLAARAAYSSLYGGNTPTEMILSGGKGSAAASLDYAISKQPAWLTEMFGADRNGESLIRRILVRVNPERKRPGPVSIALNVNAFDPSRTQFFMGSTQIQSEDALWDLSARLHDGWNMRGRELEPSWRAKEQRRKVL